jgi:hypothetical protein
LNIAGGDSTVVEHSPHHFKVEVSSPSNSGNRREKGEKIIFGKASKAQIVLQVKKKQCSKTKRSKL